MPIHDWTRVSESVFHDFQLSWSCRLSAFLNRGLLPAAYYAMTERSPPRMPSLYPTLGRAVPPEDQPGVSSEEVPPAVAFRRRPSARRQPRRRRSYQGNQVAIRDAVAHQVVGLVEFVNPWNKARKRAVRELAEKVARCLESGLRILLIDLLPPGEHDPAGIHGAVWRRFDTRAYRPPRGRPLTTVSYDMVANEPEAYIEPTAVGRELVAMPLFLAPGRYVTVPLEATYAEAFASVPGIFQDVLTATDAAG